MYFCFGRIVLLLELYSTNYASHVAFVFGFKKFQGLGNGPQATLFLVADR